MKIFLIVAIVVVIVVLVILFITSYNKFQIALIKISEACENIDILLYKKTELITNINNIIEDKKEKKKIDIEDTIHEGHLSTFELNKKLNGYSNEILEIVEYNKDVKLNDDEMKLVEELKKYNNDLLGAEKYYNVNVVEYNKLVKCFPSNIVGKIKRYKLKDFYSNEKEEVDELLKK